LLENVSSAASISLDGNKICQLIGFSEVYQRFTSSDVIEKGNFCGFGAIHSVLEKRLPPRFQRKEEISMMNGDF
jgi:hypothetical protein